MHKHLCRKHYLEKHKALDLNTSDISMFDDADLNLDDYDLRVNNLEVWQK